MYQQLSLFSYSSYWTDEQEKIFEFVLHGKGNAVLDAVAGSGKTSTIVEAANRLKHSGKVRGKQGKGLFVAFNKSIATELEERLKGTKFTAKTLNAMGFGLLRKQWFAHKWEIDTKKYRRIAEEISANPELYKSRFNFKQLEDFTQLLDFLRKTNTPLSIRNMTAIASLFRLNVTQYFTKEHYEFIYPFVYIALKRGNELTEEHGIIDFTDQLYAPVHFNISSKTLYDYIFVDEAQDLSNIQIRLLEQFCHENTRLFFVGDRRQSIYLFNGATPNSMDYLEEEYNSKLFDLSTCFRCPNDHIKLAQEYNPKIRYSSRHKSGDIRFLISKEQVQHFFPRILTSGEPFLILSRFNAPIIKLCHQLNFTHNIPSKIRGRDLIPQLIALAKRIFPDGNIPSLGRALDAIARYRNDLLAGTSKQTITEDYLDRIKSVENILYYYHPPTINTLREILEGIFEDEQKPVVQLSSIHRAKGLECENVIVLKYSQLPVERSDHSPLESQQEDNLVYVALTRSTKNLYLIHDSLL